MRFKNLERFGFGPNVMKKLRVCPRCGKAVKTRADACPECDERLPCETLFDRYKKGHRCCPACDTVLAPDSFYCPNCGKQIWQKAEDCQETTPTGEKRNET